MRFGKDDVMIPYLGRVWAESEEHLMTGGWPLKKERELIKLARAKRSAEQIANKLDASLPQVFKVARRLGVDLGPEPPKLDRRRGPRAPAGRVPG
jgi:hypothetical protein